jgi:integrase
MRHQHIPDTDWVILLTFLRARSKEKPIYAMIELAMVTGMRCDELIRIEHTMIDTYLKRIYIDAAKGSESAWVPIPDESIPAAESLYEMLCEKQCTLAGLVSRSGNDASAKRNFRNYTHKVYQQALSVDKYTVHSLRHTFALHCLKSFNYDLIKTQMAMRHKSINSTVQYLHYIKRDELAPEIIEAVNRCIWDNQRKGGVFRLSKALQEEKEEYRGLDDAAE